MVSDNHLRELNTSKDSNESAMLRIMQEFGLEPFGLNAIEASLCETSPGRTEAMDCFIKEQDLLMMNKQGRRMKKPYGSIGWNELNGEEE
jgi:hypothetical protein